MVWSTAYSIFVPCGLKISSCQVQGESHITSHLHHIATSDIAHHGSSNQAQARPEGQDKGVHHFLKTEKTFPVPSPNLNLYTNH